MTLKQLTAASYWGEIPHDWKLIPIRQGFSLIGSGTTPPTGDREFFDGSIPWVTTSELRENKILSSNQTVTELAIEQFSALKIFPKDTVLIAMYGATIGRVAILGIPACVNQAVCAFANPTRFIPEFVAYTLQASKDFLLSLVSGGGQPNLNAEKITSHLIPCPPISQQRQIADYLDRATQKIDALIAAKKRLLELLAEKRRALITQAVTRGLNPDVPLRDSGIEWLGEIPSHWKVVQLRWFVQTLEQGWSPQADEREPSENEWGVLKLNAVKDGKFDPSKAKALPQDLEIPENLEIQPSDFLVTRANTPDLVGNVCYVEQTRKCLILSDLIYRLRLKENQLDGQFLSYFLQSPIGRSQIEIDARGSSASMVKISQGHILDWLLFVPPITEQKEIVNYLGMKSSKIDALQTVTKHAIGLLQERRTSLISAAVTGQLQIPA